MLAPTSTTTKEKQEGGGKEEVKGGAGRGKLLDKDWGAKIPDYISRSILSLLVFIMGLTMKGDWLLVLALRDRAAKESLPVVEEEEYGDLAIWLQQKFDGYFSVL